MSLKLMDAWRVWKRFLKSVVMQREIPGSSKLLVQTLLILGKIMRNIDINGGHDLSVLLVNTPQPLP